MAQHIITGSGVPMIRPEHPGQHYIDESADPRVTYIGLSTDDQTPVADCWQEVGSGGGATYQSLDISSGTPSVVLSPDFNRYELLDGDGSVPTPEVDLTDLFVPGNHGDYVVVLGGVFSGLEITGLLVPVQANLGTGITVTDNVLSWSASNPVEVTFRLWDGKPNIQARIFADEIGMPPA